jgi:hypothetical protein
MQNRIYVGDASDGLVRMSADGVVARTCVTSPPYFGLRSYVPGLVRLRKDAPEWVLEELRKRGVLPVANVEINP